MPQKTDPQSDGVFYCTTFEPARDLLTKRRIVFYGKMMSRAKRLMTNLNQPVIRPSASVTCIMEKTDLMSTEVTVLISVQSLSATASVNQRKDLYAAISEVVLASLFLNCSSDIDLTLTVTKWQYCISMR
jgi:hypothetical protein